MGVASVHKRLSRQRLLAFSLFCSTLMVIFYENEQGFTK